MRLLSFITLALALTLPAMSGASAQGTALAAADATAYLHVYIEAAPSAASKVAALLKDMAAAARKESGVLRFDVLRRVAPSNQFAIVGTWKDEASLDAHQAGAATKKFREKVEPLLLAPLDDRVCIAFASDADAGAPAAAGAVYVLTHVDIGGPNPQNMNAFVPVLKAFGESSRKAPGALRYDVLQQKSRNNHFQVLEIWRNAKAAEDFQIAAPTKDYRAKFSPVAGALYDRRVYKAL